MSSPQSEQQQSQQQIDRDREAFEEWKRNRQEQQEEQVQQLAPNQYIMEPIDPNLPIESIYPEVAEVYRKHANSVEYWVRAQDRTYRMFQFACEGSVVTREIGGLYRVKGSQNKEYVYFTEYLKSIDYIGNPKQWDWIRGKVEVPIPHFEFIQDAGEVLATGIEGFDTKYTIEMTKDNIENIIMPQLTESTKFVIDTGARLYSCSREVFFEDKFEDAEEACITGKRLRVQTNKGAKEKK